jgi:hypothetical protein
LAGETNTNLADVSRLLDTSVPQQVLKITFLL